MTNYGMSPVIVMAEAGIFLGHDHEESELKEAYNACKNDNGIVKLPDITMTFISDEEAEEFGEFSESKMSETIDLESIMGDNRKITELRFKEIVGCLIHASGRTDFDKINIEDTMKMIATSEFVQDPVLPPAE